MGPEAGGVDDAPGECRARGGPSTGAGRPPTWKKWLWVQEETTRATAGAAGEEQCESRSECGQLPRGRED